uniref:Uncharacterized protein n=1 Tax=Rhizophora mucronata TaxID=61149 RepID=A0A2P2QDA2_RHIMU
MWLKKVTEGIILCQIPKIIQLVQNLQIAYKWRNKRS